jgi:hypothetical protein
MEDGESATAFFRGLEEQLLRPDVRSSAEKVAHLLADEFVEIGSSGRVFDKQQIIEALRSEESEGQSPAQTAEEFTVRSIAENVALVTYRTVRWTSITGQEVQTLRSSIWKLIDGRWQMIFHQGTPARRSG